jgi:hypothetical protein
MVEYVSLIIGIGAGIAAIIGVLTAYLTYRAPSHEKVKGEILHYRETRTDEVVDTLQNQLDALRASIEEAGLSEKQAIEIGSLSTRIEKVESNLQGLRKLLFDNPEATVTIPLIKKDIESLSRDNENLRRELERISGFTKWFIGIMITMSIGLLGIAVSILLRG